MLAADSNGRLLTRIGLLQDADDLFFGKSSALGLSSPSCQFTGNSPSAWTGILGEGQSSAFNLYLEFTRTRLCMDPT